LKRSGKLPLPTKQYARDARWIEMHYTALSRAYANKWIAVHKGRVVASGSSSASVERAARKKTGASELPVHLVDDGAVIY
jgi:ABC-type phosphate/phosphonate transport system ATPase subunit